MAVRSLREGGEHRQAVQPFLVGFEAEERKRDLSQFYTPPRLAERLWHWAPKPRTGNPFRVLEPAAGTGALILPMLEGPIVPAQIVAYELDPANIEKLEQLAANTTHVEIIVRGRDFLADPNPGHFDLAHQNPPFEDDQASAFIRRALECAPITTGIFPACLPYGQTRFRELWRHVDIRRVAYLERVKFGGDFQPMTDFMVGEFERCRHGARSKGEPMTANIEWW